MSRQATPTRNPLSSHRDLCLDPPRRAQAVFRPKVHFQESWKFRIFLIDFLVDAPGRAGIPLGIQSTGKSQNRTQHFGCLVDPGSTTTGNHWTEIRSSWKHFPSNSWSGSFSEPGTCAFCLIRKDDVFFSATTPQVQSPCKSTSDHVSA